MIQSMLKPDSKVVIGDFVAETFLKKNLHLDEADLLERVKAAIKGHYEGGISFISQGYREGVHLVSIDPTGFKARHRKLVEGDYLFGKYASRVEGETPRKRSSVLTVGDTPNACYVDAVLYHRDVLDEGESKVRDYDYEVVAFLAKETPCDEPMDVETLLHNFFLSDGGTSTKQTDEEFVASLRKSHEFWRERAFIY